MTPSFLATSHTFTDWPLKVKAVLRAITSSAETFDKSVVMSSLMPSLKYSCSGSPLMFWNGSTQTETSRDEPARALARRRRRSGELADAGDQLAPAGRSPLPVPLLEVGALDLVERHWRHGAVEAGLDQGQRGPRGVGLGAHPLRFRRLGRPQDDDRAWRP